MNEEYCVVKEGETTPIPGGCHKTKEAAEKHQAALYASESIKGDISLEDKMSAIRRAIWSVLENMATPASGNAYPVAIYDSYAIICWGNTHYRLEYTMSGAYPEIAPVTSWAQVELQWVEIAQEGAKAVHSGNPPVKSLADVISAGPLALHGSPIKAVGGGKIEGYLLNFTDEQHPDLYGEYFTDETFYDIEDGERVTFYYNHGQDEVMQKRVLGKGKVKRDKVGLWVEGQLALRDEYEKAIYAMVEAGKLGFSSGTLPFLVEYEQTGKSWWIKSWPIGKDASLTPRPIAGPKLTAVSALKGLSIAIPTSTQGEPGDGSVVDDKNIALLLLAEIELLEAI